MELWFSEKHTPSVKFSIQVDRQLYCGQSEFQRIDIFDSKEFGRFLTGPEDMEIKKLNVLKED